MNVENTRFYGAKTLHYDVTISSENSQGNLLIPCKFYSSLANQIMCNKQSALELYFLLKDFNVDVFAP